MDPNGDANPQVGVPEMLPILHRRGNALRYSILWGKSPQERNGEDMVTVQVDHRFRITIPKEERGEIAPGDTLCMETVEEEGVRVYRYAKALNPFDVLASHALNEYRDGKTLTLDEVFAGDDDTEDAR